jgi:integrase
MATTTEGVDVFDDTKTVLVPEKKTTVIDGSPAWQAMCTHLTTCQDIKTMAPHLLKRALYALQTTLRVMYTNDDPTALITTSQEGRTRITFSKAISDTMLVTLTWKVKTAQKVLVDIRRILRQTGIHPDFIKTIRVIFTKKNAESGPIAHKYENTPAHAVLQAWLIQLQTNTRIKSNLGLRTYINFFIRVATESLGINLGALPSRTDLHDLVTKIFTEEKMLEICGTGPTRLPNAAKLNAFLTVLEYPHVIITKKFMSKLESAGVEKQNTCLDDDDGSDHHRISSDDLDKIHDAAKNSGSVFDFLLFKLLISTGMRIGGFAKIKVLDVAQLSGNGGTAWVIKDYGKTTEKGNKQHRFQIQPDVKDLMLTWLTKARPADDSPYLFPGNGGHPHMSTCNIRLRFSNICKSAGVSGKEFHPHAMRHTFAHLMLEADNPAEIVRRLLGHNSVKTTETVYLKESIAEIGERVKYPWHTVNDSKIIKKREPPKFMSATEPKKKRQKCQIKKKKKAEALMAQLKAMREMSTS